MDSPEYLQVINTDKNNSRYVLLATISLIAAIRIDKTPKVGPQFSRVTFPFAEAQKDVLSAPLRFKTQPWLVHRLMKIPSKHLVIVWVDQTMLRKPVRSGLRTAQSSRSARVWDVGVSAASFVCRYIVEGE